MVERAHRADDEMPTTGRSPEPAGPPALGLSTCQPDGED
jgi:hypothetical protein